MLFAAAIQLSAETVFAGNEASQYLRFLSHGNAGNDVYTWWLAPRMIAFIERDVGATLVGLGSAVFVELSFRVWRRLRDERLSGDGAIA